MLYTQLREAHETTAMSDKIVVLIVFLIAMGVLIIGIRAILGSVINHDDRDL